MNFRFFFLSILMFFFSIFYLSAQNKKSEMLWVVNKDGDTLITSKIFKFKTNEDQVSFMYEGSEKVLYAENVKSYFNKNRTHSIIAHPGKQSKLVSIIQRGNVSLAKSYLLDGTEILYVLVDEKWIRLDPRTKNLKPQLSELIPDFDQNITQTKIYYNLVSLGKSIAEYNKVMNPNASFNGKFRFHERSKIGVFGSLGPASLVLLNSRSELNNSASFTFGANILTQHNRLFSSVFQLGYSQGHWSNDNIDLKLKTLDLTSLLNIPLYNKSNYYIVSAALGLNFKIDLASEISSFIFGFDSPLGLSGLGIGYDFQLHGSIGDKYGIFASYQHMPELISSPFGVFQEQNLELKISVVRLGVYYYFYSS